MDESTVKALINALGKYKDVYTKKELEEAILKKGYDMATAKEVVKRMYAAPAFSSSNFQLPKFAMPVFAATVVALLALIILFVVFPTVEVVIETPPDTTITDTTPPSDETTGEEEVTMLPPGGEKQLIEETVGDLTYTSGCNGEYAAIAVKNAKVSPQFIGFSTGCNFSSEQTIDTAQIKAAMTLQGISEDTFVCYGWWPEDSFEVAGSQLKSIAGSELEVVFKAECGVEICPGYGDSCSISKYMDQSDKQQIAQEFLEEEDLLKEAESKIESIPFEFKSGNYQNVDTLITESLQKLEEFDTALTAKESKAPQAYADYRARHDIAYYKVLALESIVNLNNTFIDDAAFEALVNSTPSSYETAYPIVLACETANAEYYNKMNALESDYIDAGLYNVSGLKQMAQDTQFACVAMRDLAYNAPDAEARRSTFSTRFGYVLEAAGLKD
ncbi:MAG: hypothetical protein JXA43_03615 [Candidatus Diapherotrites archaeon]|nr:hypothetical protein [Candidatus Diapherotrites archaeon]